MLTTRSSVLLLIAGIATFKGLLQPSEVVALMGLTLFFWLAFQWLWVQWGIRSQSSIVKNVQRQLDSQSHDYFTLAVNQSYQVVLQGNLARGYRGFRISLRDVLPEACRIVGGHSQLVLDKGRQDTFELSYSIQPQACGQMEISGVMLLIEDPNGMFRGQRYIPLPQRLTVLPFMIRPQTTTSVLKTNNLQQIVGHHRHKRPGISSELLEIRDYQAGDPPRSIAWKPTARLGKLMSCEFESVVPIRTTIFADLASYEFTGRPGIAVADRVITSVAATAKLLLADRDPVACVLATENGTSRLPPGHGERQLSKIIHALLNTADPNPRLEYLQDDAFVRIVFREVHRRFPTLLLKKNSFFSVGRSLLRPMRNKNYRIKCRLAPVLSELLNLPLGCELRLINDAQVMRRACEAWVRKYPLVTTRINAPEFVNEKTLRSQTMQQLCQRLLESRARAKDNELFVIVGPLPQSSSDLERLLQVLRVCRAAGHRVMFIDAGLPDPHAFIQDETAIRVLKAASRQQPKFDTQTIKQMSSLGVRCATIQDPRLMETVAVEVGLIRSGKFRSAQFGNGRSVPGGVS
ncbi:MAG: DUF58 domain-containing protein [Pirellulaceae bacterium]|nr:DUF58 domain-containing protein [Pirellulaceae bacterium]